MDIHYVNSKKIPSDEHPVRPASSAHVQIPVFGLKTRPAGHVYILA